MSILSPALRSRPFGHRQLRAGQVIGIGLITWLGPAGLGALLVALTVPFAPAQNPGLLFEIIGGIGGLLVFAPIYGIMAVPLALLLGGWAMRFGVAGWAVALGTAAVLPAVIGGLYQLMDPTAAAIGSMLVLTPFVLIHAIILWLATRLIAPQALLP